MWLKYHISDIIMIIIVVVSESEVCGCDNTGPGTGVCCWFYDPQVSDERRLPVLFHNYSTTQLETYKPDELS